MHSQGYVLLFTIPHLKLPNLCIWERKFLKNIDYCYHPYKRKKINLSYFLAPSFYVVVTFTRNVFLAPDQTRLEREKHKKLVSELRKSHPKGVTGLMNLSSPKLLLQYRHVTYWKWCTCRCSAICWWVLDIQTSL